MPMQAVRIGWEGPCRKRVGGEGVVVLGDSDTVRYQTRRQRAESSRNRLGTYSRLCPVGRDRCGCM